MATRPPDLSVVIPALNEATHLPFLLQDLSWQKNIQIEVIVVDGGSDDQTLAECKKFENTNALTLTIVNHQRGRATQLNKGAELCHADDILFLHADSRLRNASLLSNARKFLQRQRERSANNRLCGHFPLIFSSSPGQRTNYYFYESKTRLNKPDCINGDQGFWISKSYFEQLGMFDTSLPYMEDARLANRIADENNWITLPGEIETSARRFESEGFTRRQILNSFLCNFNAIGESDYLHITDDVYRQQNETTALLLRPFLKITHQYMLRDGIKAAARRWYQTGTYIAGNAWQLAFAIDCRKNRKLGLSPTADDANVLQFYEKHLSPITSWPLTRAITGIAAILWFYSLFLIK